MIYNASEDLTYKPDFFIYSNNELERIIELKAKSAIDEITMFKVEQMKKLYGIHVDIFTHSELKQYAADINLDVNFLINEWISSPYTSTSNSFIGEKNTYYGIKHSDNTKKIISDNSLRNWNNLEITSRMLNGLRKGTRTLKLNKGTPLNYRVKREIRKCLICNNEFECTINSHKKLCSNKCATINARQKQIKVKRQQKEKVYNQIKETTLKWCEVNRELVLNTPFNKITTNLKELLNLLEEQYNIKDMRTISTAVSGQNSRKFF